LTNGALSCASAETGAHVGAWRADRAEPGVRRGLGQAAHVGPPRASGAGLLIAGTLSRVHWFIGAR